MFFVTLVCACVGVVIQSLVLLFGPWGFAWTHLSFFFFPPIHFASARHQCQLLFTPDPGHSFAACVQKDYLFLFLSSFHPANGRGVYKSWKQSLLVTLPLTHTHCPWADAFSPDVFLTQILFGIFSKNLAN
jgi:hypothetical protein